MEANAGESEDAEFQAAFAREIVALFPGCPTERAESIARHAGARRSGRVGRSAAGRAFDAKAVTLAVVASVRHADTTYDSLLMSGMSRSEARDRVRDRVDQVRARFRVQDAARTPEVGQRGPEPVISGRT